MVPALSELLQVGLPPELVLRATVLVAGPSDGFRRKTLSEGRLFVSSCFYNELTTNLVAENNIYLYSGLLEARSLKSVSLGCGKISATPFREDYVPGLFQLLVAASIP